MPPLSILPWSAATPMIVALKDTPLKNACGDGNYRGLKLKSLQEIANMVKKKAGCCSSVAGRTTQSRLLRGEQFPVPNSNQGRNGSTRLSLARYKVLEPIGCPPHHIR